MSAARLRKLLLLALVAGVAYWIYRTRPTVTSFVDELTGPLFRNKAVVEESERKRVVGEAAPAVGQDQAVDLGTLREQMRSSEVRDLIGSPDKIEVFREDGEEKVRWIYRRLGRVLVLKDNRVVSIEIR